MHTVLGVSPRALEVAAGCTYRTRQIPKLLGGTREVSEPELPLKRIQRRIAFWLTRHAAVHPAAHGFVEGHSIVTGARVHADAGAQSLLAIDLADFFGTITVARVAEVLRATPLAGAMPLVTYHGVLPQGAPSSPIIANLVARGLDIRLAALGYTYTRYADDLGLSSPRLITETDRALDAIHAEGFLPAPGKVQLQTTLPPANCQHLSLYGLVIAPGRIGIPMARLRRYRRVLQADNTTREARGILSFVHMVYGPVLPSVLRAFEVPHA